MTNKKSKFFTFCFSLIPGAGEMYLGFYKMGISLMCIFGIILGITGMFSLPALSFLLPVVWFYSFFHVHNLNSMPDEEFYALEDNWIVPFEMDSVMFSDWVRKYQKVIAGILILLGINILWNLLNNFINEIMWSLHLPESFISPFFHIMNRIPQGVIAMLIIILGVRLIKNKKEDLDNMNNDMIPSPPYIEVKTEERKEDRTEEKNEEN